MNDLSRRRLFGLLAAPAIVRAASLMPVSVWRDPIDAFADGFLNLEEFAAEYLQPAYDALLYQGFIRVWNTDFDGLCVTAVDPSEFYLT